MSAALRDVGPTGPTMAHGARAQRWHGAMLVLIGVAIPLGEGAAAVAMALLAVAMLWRHRALEPRLLTHGAVARILAGLGTWLGAGLLAVILGGEGWLKPAELGRWAPWLLVPLTVLSATALPRIWLRRAAAGFILSLLIAALLGLVQYTFNVQTGQSWLRAASGALSQGLVPGQNRAVAGGFYFHRLKLAHVLLVGISALGARQVFATLSLRQRSIEAGLLATLGAALLFTFTRGAFLGLAAAALGCVLWASWRWRGAAVVLALMLALSLTAASTVRERVQSMTGAEASSVRAFIWAQATRILVDHPWGVGLGNYSQVVGRYYDSVDPSFSTRTYPHHVLLAAWVETGPVGLAGYAWAWCSFMGACVRRLSRSRQTQAPQSSGNSRAVAAAGLAGAFAFWTVGLTHDVLYHNAVGYAFCGLMAWCLASMFAGRSASLNEGPSSG